MFKKCLAHVLICVFLVKLIRDAESSNELFLAFSFNFCFRYYIGKCIVSSLFYKTTKKINIEIEPAIKDYNATPTTTSSLNNKFLHSEMPEKKKYEWYEHDLMTYINDLKYEHFIEDTDSHFSCAKVTNFDLIDH